MIAFLLPLSQRHFLSGLWPVSLGVHIWRPPRSCCNGWHCCDRPGENLHRSDWLHQTAIQWQHPLDQRGRKTQNGQWLSGQRLPAVTLSQCISDKETLMLTSSAHSVCLGRGIPSQNPLLWPERKSLHRFGYQPGDRWWKSFSKWINWPLRRLFRVYCGLHQIQFSLESQQHLVLPLLLRLPWFLAETIMM